jgi:ABC-2 type transport system ATP-binding protein
LNEVQQVCQSVAIMKEGRIIARGAVSDLLRQEGLIRVSVPAPERDRARVALTATAGIRLVSEENDDFLIDANGGGEMVNRTLVAAGIYASEIATETRNLEDVFLQLTNAEEPR